jgi:hypothetical protein
LAAAIRRPDGDSRPGTASENAKHLFANDILSVFVGSQSQKYRLTKLVVSRPLGKFDLDDQYGFDPVTAFHEFSLLVGRRTGLATVKGLKARPGHGFIDLFWRGVPILEHKASAAILPGPNPRLLATSRTSPAKGSYDDGPRYAIVSDFARIAIHDLEPEDWI